MKLSYVGITGYTAELDVLEDANFWKFMPGGRKLMVGALMSTKTLRGLAPASYPNRNIAPTEVNKLFYPLPQCLNLIHYHSKNPIIHPELLDALEIAGANCHGFQLNVVWPDRRSLETIALLHPNIVMIMQISNAAMQILNYDATQVMKQMAIYYHDGLINGALIDPSGGLGSPMNTEFTKTMLRAHKDHADFDDFYFGVAGGLSGRNIVEVMTPLLEINPNLSWDAEARLRKFEGDLRDPHEVGLYLTGSKKILGGYA